MGVFLLSESRVYKKQDAYGLDIVTGKLKGDTR